MPLQNEADYGTEARGARSEEYCTYCYQNGGFTADCTMDEMIDFCIRFEQQQNPGLDAEDAAAPCARGTPRSSAGSRRRADAYAARRSGPRGGGHCTGKHRARQGRTNSTRRLLAPRVCAKISGLHPQDVMRQCIRCIAQPGAVYQRRGKNWYITSADCEFVVNAGSGTVITAHRRPPPQNGS